MRFVSWRGYFNLPIVVAMCIVASVSTHADGALQFYPQRLVLDGRQRSAELTLVNSGSKPAGYSIEMIDILYEDNATITVVDTVDKLPANFPSARSLVRFSPRRVRLAAGESQTVRVLVKRDTKLPDGEYRVHARFVQLPDVVADIPLSDDNVKRTSDSNVSIDVAAAIPVIIRQGNTSAIGSVQSVTLAVDKKVTTLDLKLSRVGNRSLLTDLVLFSPENLEVNRLDGVALPVPNPWRRVFFAYLKLPHNSCGRVVMC